MSCPSCAGGNILGPCGSPTAVKFVVAGCGLYIPDGVNLWPPNGTYATALAFVNAFDMTTLEWGQVYNLGYGHLGGSNHSITSVVNNDIYDDEIPNAPIYALTQGGATEMGIQSPDSGPYYSAWSRVTYQEQTGFGANDGRQYINIVRCQLNVASTEIYALGTWNWIEVVGPDFWGQPLALTMPPTGNPAPDSCTNGDVTSPPTVIDVPVPSCSATPTTGTSNLYTAISVVWEGGTCSDPP